MKKKISIVLVLILGMVAERAKADFFFDTPTKLPNVNSSSREFNPSISVDCLSLYFNSNRSGGIGGIDIWVATRETTDDPWGTPMNLGPPVNTPGNDWGPSISSDGLSLYFDISQSGTSTAVDDIWVATRETTDDDWGNLVNLGPTVNSSSDDCYQYISADGLSLYFSSSRSGGYGNYDLWVTTRETIHDPWGTPENLGPTVNSTAYEVDPAISADGRILFFTSTNSPSSHTDIWMSMRATTDDPWSEPANLGSSVNSSVWEDYPNISADGNTLFFRASKSGRYGGGDLWQAQIIPMVDFNGDGIVDADDMSIMVDYWGTDESLCDIGPMPWGDGIIDVEDLKVLSEHLFEEIFPPELVAYWKIDEEEGDISYNSISDNHGVLSGNPTWQPDCGQVAGALKFDGIDDYISTDFVLNPAEGSFSVLAWIKDGAPGQVILSQTDGTNWLSAEPSEGKLMTELVPPTTRTPLPPLISDTLITDGNWHHISFVWNGVYRTLYVDGIVVAEDMQSNLAGSSNGMYIGTGNNRAAGTFFSGLIDDVRIYNKALTTEQIAALVQ